MRITRPPKSTGVCFAWLPKRTPDGKVWLEWVHWDRLASWGWGSGDTYRYERLPPENVDWDHTRWDR